MKRVLKTGMGAGMGGLLVSIFLSVSLFSCRINVEEPEKTHDTPPAVSGAASPADGAKNVKTLNLALSWHLPALEGKTGIRYDIFLGKEKSLQTVLVRDYKDTSYNIPVLDPGAAYFWRVDYLDGSVLKTGAVWSFTTTSVVNRKPVFIGLRDTAIKEGQPLRLQLSAPDPDGDSVTYSMTGPTGAVLTAGVFAWTPTTSQSGKHQVRFIAQDNGMPRASDTAVIFITVANVSGAPVLQQPRDTAVNEGQTLRLTLAATDPDGDTLIYSMANAPSGATLSAKVFTWTPDTSQAGTYLLDFVVVERTADSLRDTASVRVTVKDVAPGSDLLAYWDFNEGAGAVLADKSGGRNEGRIVGATWVDGIEGKGLAFNGTNQYVRIDSSQVTGLNFTGEELTISAWIKPTGTGSAANQDIIDCSHTATGYRFGYQPAGGNIKLSLNEATSQTSAGGVIANRWNHVVGVYGRDDSLRIWINGKQYGSKYSAQGVVKSGVVATLGAYRASAVEQFSGAMDEIRVFSRALTPVEIAAEWDKYKDKADPNPNPNPSPAKTLMVGTGAAYATVYEAVAAAGSGDTVLVGPGTYPDSIRVKHKRLVIRSSGGAAATILTSKMPGRTVSVDSGSLTLEGFTIDNALHTSPAIAASAIDSLKIIGCIFRNNTVESLGGAGGGTRGSVLRLESAASSNSRVLLQNNVIHGNKDNDALIYISTDLRIDILNNLIFGNTAVDYCAGLWLRNTVKAKTRIDHLTLYKNQAARADVIETLSGEGGTVSNSVVYGNTGGIGSAYAVSFSSTANPLFKDPANNDFHLQAGSPAKDAGDPNSPKDPDGTRADMGVVFDYLPAPFGP